MTSSFNINRFAFLWILLLSTTTFAADLTNDQLTTKYLNQCPTINNKETRTDLSPEMPPIRSQDSTQWCATYASIALLEHFYYKKTGIKKKFSILDLNSMDSSNYSPEDILDPQKRYLDILSGSTSLAILNGVQAIGALAEEKDLPFDQSLLRSRFQSQMIARLSLVYLKSKTEANNCCEPEAQELDYLAPPTELTTLAKSAKSKTEFSKMISGKYPLFKINSPINRTTLPPFTIQEFASEFSDGSLDLTIESLAQTFQQGHPVTIGMCIDRLSHTLNPEDYELKKNCVAHVMVALGMKKENGECKILIRNSHGAEWPYWPFDKRNHPGLGMQWVSIEDFKKSLLIETGNKTYLHWISDKSAGQPRLSNKMMTSDHSYDYTGETWRGRTHGKGHVRQFETEYWGLFENGKFIRQLSASEQQNLESSPNKSPERQQMQSGKPTGAKK